VVGEVDAGASVDAVARRHRVKASTLRWWRSQLRKKRGTEPGLRLLPVVVDEPMLGGPRDPAAETLTELVLEARSVRIVLRGPLSAEQLSAIFGAVTRPC